MITTKIIQKEIILMGPELCILSAQIMNSKWVSLYLSSLCLLGMRLYWWLIRLHLIHIQCTITMGMIMPKRIFWRQLTRSYDQEEALNNCIHRKNSPSLQVILNSRIQIKRYKKTKTNMISLMIPKNLKRQFKTIFQDKKGSQLECEKLSGLGIRNQMKVLWLMDLYQMERLKKLLKSIPINTQYLSLPLFSWWLWAFILFLKE